MDRNTEASIRTLRGPKGDKGDPGAGLMLRGRLDDPNLLPPYPDDGEAYLIGDDAWVAVDGMWTNAGPVRGPQGPMGPRGPQGIPGEQGDPGPEGLPGPPPDPEVVQEAVDLALQSLVVDGGGP